MMGYIIIPTIIIIALLVTGFVIRRNHIKIIQRMEQQKLQIQHKPIYEELTKVKALNMNGQTEEMFERWRTSWTEVMDTHMPKIDSLFFDAEELIDRFRFKKATSIEREIEEYIVKCDKEMNLILKELEELIGSEEKNRIEIEQLNEFYRSARKTLLAHQHSFGPALSALEKKLEQFVPRFEEFDLLTADGNYLQAREVVINLTNESHEILRVINEVPTLLVELQTKIPGSIQELLNGQREMEERSYYLRHLEMTEALQDMEKEVATLKELLSVLDVHSVKNRITKMNDTIDSFYELLEKEVIARKYVDQNCERLHHFLNDVWFITQEVNDEAVFVQQSYQLSEEEAEIPKQALKQLESLQRRYAVLAARVAEEQSAYSSLQEELIEMSEEIERIKEQQERFSNTMKNLRIDENKTRAQLAELKKILQDAERLLHRANMPGIPEEMDARLEEAEEHIYIVMKGLQETPLNMNVVRTSLQSAEKCIKEVNEYAREMVENVVLVERIIQYGNRYRATNPKMHARLLEAEEAFHEYRYAKALEYAATAVEDVEQGAMKRIQLLVQEELKKQM